MGKPEQAEKSGEGTATAAKKPRTAQIVKDEIALVEARYKQALNAVERGAASAEQAAKSVTLQKVGEVARTFTAPEMAKLKKLRDDSKQKIEQEHAADIAAAHGKREKALREVEEVFTIGRDAVNQAETAQIREHSAKCNEEKAQIAEELETKLKKAEAKYNEAMKPLVEEMEAFEKKRKEGSVEMSLKAPSGAPEGKGKGKVEKGARR